jgi:hypothetical protein
MSGRRISLLTAAGVLAALLTWNSRQAYAATAEPSDDLSLQKPPDSSSAEWSREYDPDKLYITTRLGVWGMSLSGDTGVKNLSTSVSASFEDLIQNTNFAAFPSFELSKGNWVLAINGLYANLSDEERFTGPLGVRRGVDVTANMGVVDVGIGYTIVRGTTTTGAPFTLTPAIGGRWTYIDLEINPLNAETRSANRSWFDPYIGLVGVVGITRKLDWRNAGTIGGFGVGSQLTWTAETMLEWHFSEHVGLDVGYRVLSWDYDLSGFKWDMTLQGPWIGLSFNY